MSDSPFKDSIGNALCLLKCKNIHTSLLFPLVYRQNEVLEKKKTERNLLPGGCRRAESPFLRGSCLHNAAWNGSGGTSSWRGTPGTERRPADTQHTARKVMTSQKGHTTGSVIVTI